MDTDEEEKSNDEQEHSVADLQELPKLKKNCKRRLYRRPTNLKLEGDFCGATENTENFIEYILTGRPNLARVSTTLKLDGELETKTETKDKYIPFELSCRPPITRKSTNLHLEGLLEALTENRERFIPFNFTPDRPLLTKNRTNLNLEGEVKLYPVYKSDFVEHKELHHVNSKVPVDNLPVEGSVTGQDKFLDKHRQNQIHPVIPFLRNSITDTSQQHKKSTISVQHDKVNTPAMLGSRTQSKISGMTGFEDQSKHSYVNFHSDAYGNATMKKGNNVAERQRRKTNVLFTTETDNEAQSQCNSFNPNFHKKRHIKEPEGHLKNEGEFNSMTEKRAQYIQHPVTSKPLPLKKNTELKLEGEFECQPEYRRAYINYITREQMEKQTRHIDPSEIKSSKILNPEKIGNKSEPEALHKTKLPVPVASHQTRRQRRSSLSPSSKIAHEEKENVFGSKADIRSRSRTVGPTVSRHGPRRKTRKRFGSPVLVENLAYLPKTSPVHDILRAAARESTEICEVDDIPFVIIEKPCYCNNESVCHTQLCREQKWMPSWCSHPII